MAGKCEIKMFEVESILSTYFFFVCFFFFLSSFHFYKFQRKPFSFWPFRFFFYYLSLIFFIFSIIYFFMSLSLKFLSLFSLLTSTYIFLHSSCSQSIFISLVSFLFRFSNFYFQFLLFPSFPSLLVAPNASFPPFCNIFSFFLFSFSYRFFFFISYLFVLSYRNSTYIIRTPVLKLWENASTHA